MISVFGPFYYPKKAFVYIFHKIGDSFNGYKRDMYHFYGYGFEASFKSSAGLSNDMGRYFGSDDNEWDELKFNYVKALRISKVFTNFYRRHKAKKNRKYDMALDLSMEPLENQSERMKIKLFHEDMEYEFKIQDLLRIIKNALLTNDDLHLNSKFPKNPYNNIDFTPENLYKLYLTMKERDYPIPEIFNRFIYCKMNIDMFMIKNISYLRMMCIEDYHTQFNKKELFEEIIIMLRTIRPRNMYIHIDYSIEDVNKMIKPILTLYWHSIHSMFIEEKMYYNKLFLKKIREFNTENRTFGRIIYSKTDSKQKKYKKTNGLGEDYGGHHGGDHDENDDFLIKNYLSDEIPYYLTTLESIKNFMKKGLVQASNLVVEMDVSDENASDSDLELID